MGKGAVHRGGALEPLLAVLRQCGWGTLESKALMSNLQSSAPEILAQVTILNPTRAKRTQSKSKTCTGNIGWE